MTSLVYPTSPHGGLRGGDGIAHELVGIDGCGSAQFRGGRYACPASAGIESDESREGAGRRSRNRDGHRSAGRCRSGHRTELEPVHRRGCGDVGVGNGIGGAQGQLRGGRAVKRGWRRESCVQHPNALSRGSAAIGQGKILFPSKFVETIPRTHARMSCPLRDTPDPHVVHQRVTGKSANRHPSHTGGKGIIERQVSGQPISLDGESTETAQILDPQRKFAGQLVMC